MCSQQVVLLDFVMNTCVTARIVHASHVYYSFPSSPFIPLLCHRFSLQVASDRKQQLKSLERKIRPMEDLFREFRAWLQAAGGGLAALRPFGVEAEQRKGQLEQATVSVVAL